MQDLLDFFDPKIMANDTNTILRPEEDLTGLGDDLTHPGIPMAENDGVAGSANDNVDTDSAEYTTAEEDNAVGGSVGLVNYSSATIQENSSVNDRIYPNDSNIAAAEALKHTDCRRRPLQFNDKKTSDIKINYANKQAIYAHKNILARQSGYFKAAFSSKFSVSTNPTLDLEDESDYGALIYMMIAHMYGIPFEATPDYPMQVAAMDGPLCFRLKLFIVADKYDVPSLRNQVAEEFIAYLLKERLQPSFVLVLEKLFGHDRFAFADTSLQQLVLEELPGIFVDVFENNDSFVAPLMEGELFTAEFAAALLGKLGEARLPFTTRPCNRDHVLPDGFED